MKVSPPDIPVISNISGKPAGPEIASPGYWRRHIREQVRFYDAMQTLDTSGYEIFLEVGTTSTLISLGMQCIPHNKGLWAPTLGVNNAMFNMNPGRPDGYNDWKPILHALGQLYVNGIDVDWQAFDEPYPCKKVVLPNYPFQRERYWMPQFYDVIKHGTENSNRQQTINNEQLAANNPQPANSNQAYPQVGGAFTKSPLEGTEKSPLEGQGVHIRTNTQISEEPPSRGEYVSAPSREEYLSASSNKQYVSASGDKQPATGNQQPARVRIVAQQLQLMAEQLELLEQAKIK